jgi:hypothetical protein
MLILWLNLRVLSVTCRKIACQHSSSPQWGPDPDHAGMPTMRRGRLPTTGIRPCVGSFSSPTRFTQTSTVYMTT